MSKPFVTIELDRPRKLRYGMNQLVLLEDVLGMPVTKLSGMDFGIKALRTIVWAGLAWEDPALTQEQVGDLMDEADMTLISQKVTEALNASIGVKNSTGPVAMQIGRNFLK